MGSFYSPLSGLQSESTALNAGTYNLANPKTTDYKSQEVKFSDLFYQQLGEEGSGNLIQLGSGVGVAGIQSQFTSGSVVSTGNATDVALQGNGFFVVQNGSSSIYTRDGNFNLASNGMLTTQGGLPVMGFPAVGGVVNTNAPLSPITIPLGQIESAKATTTMGMTVNLDSTAAVGTAVPTQISVYDSLGVAHIATVTYTKSATNSWNYSITLPTGVATGSANTTGTLTFDTSGNLTSPAANVAGVNFAGLTNGAADLSITFDVLGSSGKGTITQTDAASAASATDQNGYVSGAYKDFSIAADGTVNASFSNGQTLAVGQLALANVPSLSGLKLLGNGDFATTQASGNAAIGVSGSSGLGTMQDSALEASNVNISAEFSNLIIAQRAFEANSKSVTTFDTIAQETINMIH